MLYRATHAEVSCVVFNFTGINAFGNVDEHNPLNSKDMSLEVRRHPVNTVDNFVRAAFGTLLEEN